MLTKSGIDTKLFSAHSTRHAASSAAHRAGINIATVRSCTGWSKESDTFFKFYDRPIVDRTEFAKGIFDLT